MCTRMNLAPPAAPLAAGPPRCTAVPPQVAKEFETACPSLKVDSFYGGVSIGNQVSSAWRVLLLLLLLLGVHGLLRTYDGLASPLSQCVGGGGWGARHSFMQQWKWLYTHTHTTRLVAATRSPVLPPPSSCLKAPSHACPFTHPLTPPLMARI